MTSFLRKKALLFLLASNYLCESAVLNFLTRPKESESFLSIQNTIASNTISILDQLNTTFEKCPIEASPGSKNPFLDNYSTPHCIQIDTQWDKDNEINSAVYSLHYKPNEQIDYSSQIQVLSNARVTVFAGCQASLEYCLTPTCTDKKTVQYDTSGVFSFPDKSVPLIDIFSKKPPSGAPATKTYLSQVTVQDSKQEEKCVSLFSSSLSLLSSLFPTNQVDLDWTGAGPFLFEQLTSSTGTLYPFNALAIQKVIVRPGCFVELFSDIPYQQDGASTTPLRLSPGEYTSLRANSNGLTEEENGLGVFFKAIAIHPMVSVQIRGKGEKGASSVDDTNLCLTADTSKEGSLYLTTCNSTLPQAFVWNVYMGRLMLLEEGNEKKKCLAFVGGEGSDGCTDALACDNGVCSLGLAECHGDMSVGMGGGILLGGVENDQVWNVSTMVCRNESSYDLGQFILSKSTSSEKRLLCLSAGAEGDVTSGNKIGISSCGENALVKSCSVRKYQMFAISFAAPGKYLSK